MAPKKLPDREFWTRKIQELAEEYPAAGAPRIEREIATIAIAEGRTDWPSVRQTGRILRKHRALKPEERAPFGRFSWPDAMEAGLLPWEASRVALDVLRNNYSAHGTRPSVDYVRWHWRLSLASPDTDFDQRDALVTNLLVLRDDESPSDNRFDLLVAYQPWLSGLHRSMYNDAFTDRQWEEG